MSVGLSIGISIISRNNRDAQAALDAADAALYRAKAQGGRCAPSPERSRTTPRNRKAASWRPEVGRGIGPK